MDKSGIYSISHSGGRAYIGSAVNIRKRWNVHKHKLRKGEHHSIKLQRAWNKYGEHDFSFHVVEVVEDIEQLIEREQFHIDRIKAYGEGFNMSPTAGNTLGHRHTKETKEKLAKKATGRKPSKETREKMSAALRKRKGEKRPEETCKRISEKAKGRRLSKETKRKMSEARKGKKKSPEHLKKIREASKKRIGKAMSMESRKKMSESAKRRVSNSQRDENGRFI